jgi:hypothetical protein
VTKLPKRFQERQPMGGVIPFPLLIALTTDKDKAEVAAAAANAVNFMLLLLLRSKLVVLYECDVYTYDRCTYDMRIVLFLRKKLNQDRVT